MSQLTTTFSGSGPGGVVQTLTGNVGGPVPPTGGNINIVGTGDVTVTGNPGTSTLTISVSGSLSEEFDTDSGTAIPVAGVLNIFGGDNISTSGAGNTVTVSVSGTTDHAVQVGNAAGSLTSIAVGTTNTALLGSTGADPVFGQVPNAALVNSSITLSSGNNITVVGSPVSLGGAASISVSGTTNHSLQVGNALGSLTSLGVATNGQLPIGSTGANPVLATLTAGAGITIGNGAGTITISATGADLLAYTNVNITPYVVLNTDEYLGVDCSVAPITLQFPDAPSTGRVFIVKDFGGFANTNNITITSVGGAIGFDGSLSYVMNTQYASVQLLFDGTNYQIF